MILEKTYLACIKLRKMRVYIHEMIIITLTIRKMPGTAK